MLRIGYGSSELASTWDGIARLSDSGDRLIIQHLIGATGVYSTGENDGSYYYEPVRTIEGTAQETEVTISEAEYWRLLTASVISSDGNSNTIHYQVSNDGEESLITEAELSNSPYYQNDWHSETEDMNRSILTFIPLFDEQKEASDPQALSYLSTTQMPIPETTNTYQMLQKGDKGTSVETLQRRLSELGYYTGKVDGDYGNQTFDAVTRFQKAHQLFQDGIASQETLTVLYESADLVSTIQIRGWNGNSYQYVLFGNYPQAVNGETAPILWRVLGNDRLGRNNESTFLLQSEYIIEYSLFANNRINHWRDSPIFSLLNSTFYQAAFTENERERIYQRPSYPNIFFLVETDFSSLYGLSNEERRAAIATEYVRSKYAIDHTDSFFYWTRPGSSRSGSELEYITTYDSYGKSQKMSNYPSRMGGVRPTLYLNCYGLFNAGTGTIEDPFRCK